jgi:hypothetical protein
MRFRNTFKAIAAGDLSGRVTLRKHDYLGKACGRRSQVSRHSIGKCARC